MEKGPKHGKGHAYAYGKKGKKQQFKNNPEIKADRRGNSFSFNCAFPVCLNFLSFPVNN